MPQFVRKRYQPGTPPGSLIAEEAPQVKVKITLTTYSPDNYEEREAESLQECFRHIGGDHVTWINVDRTQDAELLRQMGEQFGFHPLVLEDVIGADQSPKVEDFGDYIFITVRLPGKQDDSSSVYMEQINIFLGADFVLTIQDAGDSFELVRERLKENRGKVRKMKADYLAYSLVDLVTDRYFPVVEAIGDHIESIEDKLQDNPSPEIVREIRKVKRDLIFVRSSIWPTREVLNSLQREEPKLISDTTKIYLRDAYDHTIQIADIVETYRDILSEMFNIYLSMRADNTNEVMKILTIFATIFIPLTFVAGVYGMNFEFMPELKWKPAYFILLGVMVTIALAMLRFFRKRRWL